MPSNAVRTRFAPSPTGDLHLGGAWTALASWVFARAASGACVLRIEDIDTARVVPGSQARIEDDLRWLGLNWDDGPVLQSQRSALYESAIASLVSKGLVYTCDCSRAEIARVASAPHAGDELIYPGLCRNLPPDRPMRRPPALRLRLPDESIEYQDGAVGRVKQNLQREVGDLVLRRGDGVFAYHLAVTLDDIAMGITHVLRGADLIGSTPRQIWLARALGAEPPHYTHVPLVVATDGTRLEKRTQGRTIRELRQQGVSAARLIGSMAHALGLTGTMAPTTAQAVADMRVPFSKGFAWRREPWPCPPLADLQKP